MTAAPQLKELSAYDVLVKQYGEDAVNVAAWEVSKAVTKPQHIQIACQWHAADKPDAWLCENIQWLEYKEKFQPMRRKYLLKMLQVVPDHNRWRHIVQRTRAWNVHKRMYPLPKMRKQIKLVLEELAFIDQCQYMQTLHWLMDIEAISVGGAWMVAKRLLANPMDADTVARWATWMCKKSESDGHPITRCWELL